MNLQGMSNDLRTENAYLKYVLEREDLILYFEVYM